MTTDIALEAARISRKFQTSDAELCVLDEVSFSVKKGQIIAIIGESGSGKTTLLQIMGMLDTPSSGDVVINGISTCKMNIDQRTHMRRKHIGFVYQYHHLLPDFTARENVAMSGLISGMSTSQALGIAEQYLEMMGLQNRGEHYPNQLSGGEQQRVAISRAMFSSPEIILADEPTGNLDPETASNVINLMIECFKRQNRSAIIVTHNHDLAKRTDQIFALVDKNIQPVLV